MADDEHVALLKQGAAAWNKWRDENPNIRPDLSRADLRGAEDTLAAGVNLMRADLREADLSTANLRWAYLWGADLSKANLSGANLVKATLLETRLHAARLDGADLSNASVIGANFGGADLSGARLQHASLADTDFMGCGPHRLSHLRRIRMGSETGHHDQAAELDHHTER